MLLAGQEVQGKFTYLQIDGELAKKCGVADFPQWIKTPEDRFPDFIISSKKNEAPNAPEFRTPLQREKYDAKLTLRGLQMYKDASLIDTLVTEFTHLLVTNFFT